PSRRPWPSEQVPARFKPDLWSFRETPVATGVTLPRRWLPPEPGPAGRFPGRLDGPRLGALELGLALLGEGLEALLRVRRGEREVEGATLVLEAQRERR